MLLGSNNGTSPRFENGNLESEECTSGTELKAKVIEDDHLPAEKADGILLTDLNGDPQDHTIRTVTVRSCIVGVLMGALAASIAQVFVYKAVSLHVPALFVQLSSYLIGLGFSKIPGPNWWNPGPFSSKETGFAAIMAMSAPIESWAVEMLAAQDLYFDRHVSAIIALATMMSSQLIGYSFAGLLRSLLIYPSNTPYPSILPSVTLIRSLAGRDKFSREQLVFFKKTIVTIGIYEIFPTYLAPALQAISPWCLTLPKSPIVTQLFGGSQVTEGLGLFAISLDWATISSFGPLYIPFSAQLNQWVAVLISIFVYMAAYRYDWLSGGVQRGYPFMSANLLNATGGIYNASAAVFPDGTPNWNVVQKIGLPGMATSAILAKVFICASASTAISSALLEKWKDMKSVLFRSASAPGKEDPYRTVVKNYRDFPTYMILLILLLSSLAALLVSHYSKSGLSVLGMFVALIVSGVLSVATGFVFASTGILMNMISPIQVFGGLLFRGNALANSWFTAFAATSSSHCLNISKDLKLGQYLLLSPMSVLGGQLFGSIFGTFINYLVMELILTNERDVLLLPNGNGAMTGIKILRYQSATISWGVFAHELCLPGQRYAIIIYGMIAGLFAPIPFYFLHRWRPSLRFDQVNLTVFFHEFANFVGSLGSGQMTAIGVGLWSQFYMRRYRSSWFKKYNNILNAGLTGGTEVAILVLFMSFQGGTGWTLKLPKYFLNPKGAPDYC